MPYPLDHGRLRCRFTFAYVARRAHQCAAKKRRRRADLGRGGLLRGSRQRSSRPGCRVRRASIHRPPAAAQPRKCSGPVAKVRRPDHRTAPPPKRIPTSIFVTAERGHASRRARGAPQRFGRGWAPQPRAADSDTARPRRGALPLPQPEWPVHDSDHRTFVVRYCSGAASGSAFGAATATRAPAAHRGR
jgi:hypothetical protein